MAWRSFRLRIALLSTLLSGVVLTAFAVSCSWIVFRVGLGRIDHELMDRSFSYLSHPLDVDSLQRLDDGVQRVFGGHRPGAMALLLRDGDGQPLYQSANWPEGLRLSALPPPLTERMGPPPPPPGRPWLFGPPPGPPPWDKGHRGPPGPPPNLRTLMAGHEPWRIAVVGEAGRPLAVAMRLDGFVADFGRVRRQLTIGVLSGLVLVGLGGWLLAGRALRPVDELTRTVEQVTASDLTQRIPERREALEFDRLIRVFNQMMDRLERSFQQAARFSADAAHELKTPLTILQGELEQAHREAPEGSAQQELCTSLLEEVARLKSITGKLLLLSLADAGKLRLTLEPLDLSDLVESLAEDAQALAPQLAVECTAAPEVSVQADPHLLQQALGNLLQNAAKYNRADGSITVALVRYGSWAELRVSNTGPAIDPAAQERIFERFFRADPAHGRVVDGVGLGLSLTREILHAHGGEVELLESRDDHTVFRVRLPVA